MLKLVNFKIILGNKIIGSVYRKVDVFLFKIFPYLCYMEITGNFRLDLSEFEKLSREVGYYNAKANTKEYDENGDEFYDDEAIKKYEELRDKQLAMFEELVKNY